MLGKTNVKVKPNKKVDYVEYIESTGTQYIDTGIVPNQNQKYRIKFSLNDVVTNQVLFGSRTSGTYATSKNQVYLNSTFGSELLFFLGTSSINKNSSLVVNTLYDVEINLSEITSDYDNSSTYNLFLFALNNIGNVGAGSYMKLYEFKRYENNTLIQDFKPCKDGAGVYCLYDEVTKQYFYNQGTSEFLGGVAA